MGIGVDNAAIKFLRGTTQGMTANKNETLAAGQPFYNTETNKLYIGDGKTKLSNLSPIGNYTLTKSGTTIELKRDDATISSISDSDTQYKTATANDLGLVKIGYTTNGQNYAVNLNNGQMYVSVPWENTRYEKATTTTLGLVKSAANRTTPISPTTGGTTSGRYYGVELDSDGTMFVNVPWKDTTLSLTQEGSVITLSNLDDISLHFEF